MNQKLPPVIGSGKAAEVLGVSETTIRRYFAEGRFPGAWQVGNQVRIPTKEVEALKKRPFKRERNPKP